MSFTWQTSTQGNRSWKRKSWGLTLFFSRDMNTAVTGGGVNSSTGEVSHWRGADLPPLTPLENPLTYLIKRGPSYQAVKHYRHTRVRLDAGAGRKKVLIVTDDRYRAIWASLPGILARTTSLLKLCTQTQLWGWGVFLTGNKQPRKQKYKTPTEQIWSRPTPALALECTYAQQNKYG